ncbi:hypothetical protein C2S51_004653 [Perilla frutescens var. frutescens]|nr:hypothetical protein C2S51_004653 [Perilla frutescens var. frutescens]
MSSICSLVAQPTYVAFNTKNHQYPEPKKLASLIDESTNIKHLRQIHKLVIRRGLESSPVLNFKLQHSYSSLGHVEDSVALFNLTQSPNVFFYTSIIRGHAMKGLHEQALNFYVQMLTEKIEPDASTLSTLLKASALEIGKAIHCQVHKFGLHSDAYVRTALIGIYARNKDIVLARRLFDSMVERNLVTLTAMITGYAKKMAMLMRQENCLMEWKIGMWHMLKSKLKPNEASMVAVLSACGQVGALESGHWVHSYLGYRATLNNQVGTALIDMYSKCGSLEEARKVFNGIKDKDAVVYNAMIGGCASHGFTKEAINLFKEMPQVGLHPTDITFIGILSACAHAGLISQGWALFNAMKDEDGIQPKVEHYGCMVNLLGRPGHLEEAYELVKSMSIDADPVLWGTLLAAAGNWDDVARIRAMMKQSGVQKDPGCSSVEVNNIVHEFLAGDMKHPRSKEIYGMLEQMNKWLEVHGYASQTEEVLHNIGEAEERSLEVHSKKLALAFAFISTKRGTTIKIVKNLRVCPDCDAVIKPISKIAGKKRVMRDRNRFHHFIDGACSCGDYW